MASNPSNSSYYCRCCCNKKKLFDIHTIGIKKTSTTYVEIIAECVSPDLSNLDILPPWLCIKCSNKLNNFYRFKQMCLKTLENIKKVNNALEDHVENKVFNYDIKNKIVTIKKEEDEQENFDLQTETFNENIICEELNIVPHELIDEEKNECDVKHEVDVDDNYLYEADNNYPMYEDAEDLNEQNYEEIYEEKNEGPEEMDQNEKELQLILPQTTGKQTQCPICNKHLLFNKALLDHIKYVHFGIKYYCEICKKYFNRENRHKSLHNKDKFVCDECGEAFSNKSQFLQHIMKKHGRNGSFKCECGKTFSKSRDLNSHKYIEHNILAYKCHICDHGFVRKDRMQDHIRVHLEGRKVKSTSKYGARKIQPKITLVSPEDIPLVGDRETSCRICTTKCNTNRRLIEHIQIVHLGEKYFCKICKKYYSSEMRHNRTKHTSWSKCKECNKTFSIKKHYTDHMRNVHNMTTQETCPHICHCGKKFKFLMQFRRHKYKAHKETDFMCQICSKGYLKKDRLKEHVQMHTKEVTFPCPICLKIFYSRSSLTNHKLRLHRTGDMYVCDYCDKVFKTKTYLRNHITAHDPNNKPFACLVCGKRFRRSDHRNNHQALVHKLEKITNT